MSTERKFNKGRPLTASPIIQQLGGIVDTPEKVNEFFTIFFTTDWEIRNQKTNQKLQRGQTSTFKEFIRLKNEYPEVLREVLKNIGRSEEQIERLLNSNNS